MCASPANSSHRKPNYLLSLLSRRCSRCRTGPMFLHGAGPHLKRNMAMHEYCPACGQRLEIEVGFYYGTGYVSYALTVAIS
ncbi:MAG TPA: hypothetical protein VK907_05045, partial [Phnomibacter sp.]|nr:hypothetical protein [Phnomibacter sp.]